MAKISVDIDDDLLADVTAMSEEAGASVESIVSVLLEGFVRAGSSPLAGNYEILLRFSLGQLTAAGSAKQLHLDTEALAALTIKAGFPLPRLTLSETETMRNRFGKMLELAETAKPSGIPKPK